MVQDGCWAIFSARRIKSRNDPVVCETLYFVLNYETISAFNGDCQCIYSYVHTYNHCYVYHGYQREVSYWKVKRVFNVKFHITKSHLYIWLCLIMYTCPLHSISPLDMTTRAAYWTKSTKPSLRFAPTTDRAQTPLSPHGSTLQCTTASMTL